MSCPRTCCDCDFYACCDSAMGMDGCHFYFYEEETKEHKNPFANLLNKIFH